MLATTASRWRSGTGHTGDFANLASGPTHSLSCSLSSPLFSDLSFERAVRWPLLGKRADGKRVRSRIHRSIDSVGAQSIAIAREPHVWRLSDAELDDPAIGLQKPSTSFKAHGCCRKCCQALAMTISA